jgi:hypothetical protein
VTGELVNMDIAEYGGIGGTATLGGDERVGGVQPFFSQGERKCVHIKLFWFSPPDIIEIHS